jgi:hypothetical protein
LLGNSSQVAEIFRVPDLNAALFFAFFMLDDPPACPTRYPDQVWFALVVSAVSCAAFLVVGADYFLLAGLLAGNVWEAWRRWAARPRLGAAQESGRVSSILDARGRGWDADQAHPRRPTHTR